MRSYRTKYEEELREIISQKIPHCQIIPTDARFRFIKGKQAWLDLKCESKIDIKSLNLSVPIMGIVSYEGDIKLFNFGNNYKEYESRINFMTSYVSGTEVIYGNKQYLFFANYPLFGLIHYKLNDHHYLKPETIKQHWFNYGLDFYIWLSRLEVTRLDLDIVFTIAQNAFVFKGPFLMHNVDLKSAHLTLSALIPLIEVLEKFQYLGPILFCRSLFYDKTELLDYLDIRLFKPHFKTSGIEYAPLLGVKNYNYRLERIKEKLQNL